MKDPLAITFERMTADVSTRAAAEQWLGHRLRQLVKLLVILIVATPPAAAVVVVSRTLLKGRDLPWSEVLVLTLMWSAIAIGLGSLVLALIGIKRFRIARRVRPVLAQGTERAGRVTKVKTRSRKAGGVGFHAVVLTVTLDDGATVEASIEESTGTALPEVDEGAAATAWTLGDRHVVGTSGALFES
jgi:hypothetical protein